MVVRWTLYDPIEVTTYTMQINPNEGGTPSREKSIAYSNTSAPDGKVIMYEGRDKPQTLEWSGVILLEAHLFDLETWFLKRRQVQLTDDLGRQYWIYITDYVPKRVRAHTYPWKHSYTMKATILDWPD